MRRAAEVMEKKAGVPFRLFERLLVRAFDGDIAQGSGRRDVALVWIGSFGTQLRHESRNPLAFSHPAFSLLLSEMRGKPACANFLEGEYLHSRRRGAG